ncbi:MAG TPA: hypothetical protein VFT57_15070 [Gemmatimonadaceae bacterium]|nr:hypothetical protein [Gemmatimonadaceae bacterium]
MAEGGGAKASGAKGAPGMGGVDERVVCGGGAAGAGIEGGTGAGGDECVGCGGDEYVGRGATSPGRARGSCGIARNGGAAGVRRAAEGISPGRIAPAPGGAGAATPTGGAAVAEGAAGAATVDGRAASPKSSSMRPDSPIAITPPHTEQRARIPATGIFAGSTRKMVPHSGHPTFIARPRQLSGQRAGTGLASTSAAS